MVPVERPDQASGQTRQQPSPDRSGCCSIRCSRRSSPAGWKRSIAASPRCSPTSWKGYTIGDPLSPQTTKYPWRLDDEKLMYPFYEKAVKAGITTICIHKGLLPTDYETRSRRRLEIRHCRRSAEGGEGLAADQFRDLPFGAAAVPRDRPTPSSPSSKRPATSTGSPTSRRSRQKYGVSNVYADIGTSFADLGGRQSAFLRRVDGHADQGAGARPRVLGHRTRSGTARRSGRSRRSAGSKSPTTCRRSTASPPLGPADGPVKSAIFGYNGARLYKLDLHAEQPGRRRHRPGQGRLSERRPAPHQLRVRLRRSARLNGDAAAGDCRS